MEYRSGLKTDALPQQLPDIFNANVFEIRNSLLEALLEDFTLEEYKSVFFLLMDYVGQDNFFSLVKKDKQFLKEEFYKHFINFNNCNILIELLGIMKKYKKLRLFGLCCCQFKSLQDRKYSHIGVFWKMLYYLCEEITDDDLELLKQRVPNNSRDQIVAAEDWFCWALKNEKFSKTDSSELKIIFSNYPNCLSIIEKYEVKLYYIRTPSASLHCGIALIVNYETFDEKTNFPKREGSSVDVNNLQCLWRAFGFKTEILTNLTYSETLEKFKYYGSLDYSSYDVFICCILSHGNSNSIYSSDGIEIPIPDLIASITNNSSTLDQKPKLFFIQACQGTYIHQAVGKPLYKLSIPDATPHTSNTSNLSVPPRAYDTLKVISSIDGYVSFRNPKTGSWFIQALCKVMRELGDKRSILHVIIEVNQEVRKFSGLDNPLQIVDCSNTFGKTLILKKVLQ